MPLKNFVNIFFCFVLIPGLLWIDNQHGTTAPTEFDFNIENAF